MCVLHMNTGIPLLAELESSPGLWRISSSVHRYQKVALSDVCTDGNDLVRLDAQFVDVSWQS